jgi:hypothetical protein
MLARGKVHQGVLVTAQFVFDLAQVTAKWTHAFMLA